MKYYLSIAMTCIALSLISNKLNAQTAVYQPGQVLRVDFEGRHRLDGHVQVDTATYHPGTVLRVDFEGKHLLINHQSLPGSTYQPGPVLRIDFEGRHRKNYNQ